MAILVARIKVLVGPTQQKSEPRVAGGGDVFLSMPCVDDGVPAFFARQTWLEQILSCSESL